MMRAMRVKKQFIRGNHDRVAAGLEEGAGFNPAAREAAVWTRDHLSGRNRRFLQELPVGPQKHGELLLCHGSPHDEDEYVFTEHHAAQILAEYDAPIILYGHTHLPVIFSMDPQGLVWGSLVRAEGTFRLAEGHRYLINPGSVGQPRDRNPDASFAILDTAKRTVQFMRVPYAVEKTQGSILKAGLPRVLADRLSHGA